jgi:glutamate synthase (NADPH/NADH) small chain
MVVIGGGDTGSDCVGNANRQGAKSITQIEIMPEPPLRRTEDEPWPLWPKLKKTSSSHEEGCERLWNIKTLEFIGEKGILKGIRTIKVKWEKDPSGNMIASDIPGTEEIIPADIVLLSMGFVHPEYDGPVYDFDLSLDNRGNIAIDNNYMTSKKGVFSAGDSVRGASLVVWAIHQGREAALHIDSYLSNGVI